MSELHPVDALWFGAHPDETHRIRPATAQEVLAFGAPRIGFDKLLSVVRCSDGAGVTYGFGPSDDIERALDFELAAWFDADLDAAADLLP